MNIAEIKSKEISQMTRLKIGCQRRSLGLSRAALAEMTGFSQGYLAEIEDGRIEPSIRDVFKIAKALGVEMISLVTGESLPPAGSKFIHGEYESQLS
jgi:transcriptional regulator with XRE-family HTH domain